MQITDLLGQRKKSAVLMNIAPDVAVLLATGLGWTAISALLAAKGFAASPDLLRKTLKVRIDSMKGSPEEWATINQKAAELLARQMNILDLSSPQTAPGIRDERVRQPDTPSRPSTIKKIEFGKPPPTMEEQKKHIA